MPRLQRQGASGSLTSERLEAIKDSIRNAHSMGPTWGNDGAAWNGSGIRDGKILKIEEPKNVKRCSCGLIQHP